ncbi:hypothetical protein HI914_01303 [Erysiphe necator]|nr:hypothetical protein HI914_01303 [Erysiphe necator]
MARVTRSQKHQNIESLSSPKCQLYSSKQPRTFSRSHTKDTDFLADSDTVLVNSQKKLKTVRSVESDSVPLNTDRVCTLAVRCLDENQNKLSNYDSSFDYTRKTDKDQDTDRSIEQMNKTKDASPKIHSVESNEDRNALFCLKSKEFIVDEMPKKFAKKSTDLRQSSVDCLVLEGSTMRQNSPESLKVDDGEDSFIAQITSRSPAKPVTRVEDSVEALDQLEIALDVLHEVAKVENMVRHKTHRKLVAPTASEIRPFMTRKINTATPHRNSGLAPASVQSSLKIKHSSLSQVIAKNEMVHSSRKSKNLDINNKKLMPSNASNNFYKSHNRKSHNPKEVSSKTQNDSAETRFTKVPSIKVARRVPTTGLPQVKELKSSSNSRSNRLEDDVFTRLSNGSYKSRSGSKKIDEKMKVAEAKKLSQTANIFSHEDTNSFQDICNVSRAKNRAAKPGRVSINQTSQKNELYSKSPNLTSPQQRLPTLVLSSKQKLDLHHIVDTQGQEIKSDGDEQIIKCRIIPDKEMGKEQRERKPENTALLARAEAAELGRRAVIEWAQKHRLKK